MINHAEVVLQGTVEEIRHRYRSHKYTVQLENGEQFDYTLPEGTTLHDAINELNAKYELAGFHEVLPSMQQIFMQAVGSNSSLLTPHS